MKEKILIIEDESSMAKQLKWGLSDTYDIYIAANAADAMDTLNRESPLVVLLGSWTSTISGQRRRRLKALRGNYQ